MSKNYEQIIRSATAATWGTGNDINQQAKMAPKDSEIVEAFNDCNFKCQGKNVARLVSAITGIPEEAFRTQESDEDFGVTARIGALFHDTDREETLLIIAKDADDEISACTANRKLTLSYDLEDEDDIEDLRCPTEGEIADFLRKYTPSGL